jgi:Magnesium chelatase, subunit ChlI
MVCRRSAHNVLLLGPPGAGTSMLARRLTTILPAMTLAEALATTRIHSVAGFTGAHRLPADRAGVDSTPAAPVDRQRAPTPAGETARCPDRRLPPRVMGASPSRADTRNTYE